ncbi:hypothetical protein BC834DRAFT_149634 [Gloeopeniophorella convolvens]|nr:hypothetical protein BC834DRAFT_149634 [Gloeopeniophorella convolvens]
MSTRSRASWSGALLPSAWSSCVPHSTLRPTKPLPRSQLSSTVHGLLQKLPYLKYARARHGAGATRVAGPGNPQSGCRNPSAPACRSPRPAHGRNVHLRVGSACTAACGTWEPGTSSPQSSLALHQHGAGVSESGTCNETVPAARSCSRRRRACAHPETGAERQHSLSCVARLLPLVCREKRRIPCALERRRLRLGQVASGCITYGVSTRTSADHLARTRREVGVRNLYVSTAAETPRREGGLYEQV